MLVFLVVILLLGALLEYASLRSGTFRFVCPVLASWALFHREAWRGKAFRS